MNDPQKKCRLGTVSKNILLEGLSLNRFNGANLKSLCICIFIYTVQGLWWH